MALTGDTGTVRRFVLDALRQANAPYSEPDGELIIATCRVARPAGFFGGTRTVEEQLQLVFTPEGTARHPSAELVCAGSYRLKWFIGEARKRGFLTRGYYAEDLGAHRIEREILAALPRSAPRFSFRGQRRKYVPFLLAVLRLTALAIERREELLTLTLDLTDGSFRPELPERLRFESLVPEMEYQRVEKRRVPWREVWRLLSEAAVARAASYGEEWYRPSLQRLESEGEQLRRYYGETLAESEDEGAVRNEYLQRAGELRQKYAPMVRVELANLALLYLPVILMAVVRYDGKALPPIKYEPAGGRVVWEGVGDEVRV